jgi:hypothetical protein
LHGVDGGDAYTRRGRRFSNRRRVRHCVTGILDRRTIGGAAVPPIRPHNRALLARWIEHLTTEYSRYERRARALDSNRFNASARAKRAGSDVQFCRLTSETTLGSEGARMEWLWTWGGRSFGYRDAAALWTHDGRHVGMFTSDAEASDDEVYGPHGEYLGELLSGRLITHLQKKHHRGPSFTPYARRGSFAKYADYVGYAMYAGYEDFPKLEQ